MSSSAMAAPAGSDPMADATLIRRHPPSSSSTANAAFTQYRQGRQTREEGRQNKAVRDFYSSQDRVVDSFDEADLLIRRSSTNVLGAPEGGVDSGAMEGMVEEVEVAPSSRTAWWVNFATNLSLVVNVALLIVKIIVLASTGSLAVLSSVIDSALDIFSATVIYLTNRYMAKRNRYLFPMGKQRFEPLATIVIAAVMATAAIELVSKAIQAIVNDDISTTMTPTDLALLGVTVLSKIALYLLCRALPGTSMSTLSTDHRNDSVSNSVAMFTAWLGSTYWKLADPIGAIMIGFFIITAWYWEGKEHVLNLAGRGASPQFIQQLTWVAMHHDERVQLVDTVRAIHFGCGFLVEVDIVLPPEMPLHEAHDIGEALQHKLELLPMCDRAHVHLDFECDHGPEDEHKRL